MNIISIFTARRNARIASAVLATAIPSVRPKDDKSRHFDPHFEEVRGGVEP